ncbi:unnamed protein product [Durusdinium trenchii]|uniref:Uncharacterized protein n=2 Tax=Durusdinium trenchii TaxID=1381693 RepID=A0ABP0HX96_9DINO
MCLSPEEFLSFDQSLLLISWPSCCAYRLSQRKKDGRKKVKASGEKWAARLLQACALLSSGSMLARHFLELPLNATAVLPWASLMSLAYMTVPVPEMPLDDFVPWWSLFVILVAKVVGTEEMRTALGLQAGRLDGGPLAWSILCAIISTFALVGWSCYVRGDHGPIQNALAPLMSPVTVFPFAVLNALREELQFRMVFLGALIAGEASKCIPLMAYQMAVHSGYFALLHFLGGFPTGKSGFALVFTWSLFLDLLRVWSGGMAFVFLLHVQADVAIFVLVWLEDQRRKARAEL